MVFERRRMGVSGCLHDSNGRGIAYSNRRYTCVMQTRITYFSSTSHYHHLCARHLQAAISSHTVGRTMHSRTSHSLIRQA